MKKVLVLCLTLIILGGCSKKDNGNTNTDNGEPTFPVNPTPSSFVYTNQHPVLRRGVSTTIYPSYFGSPNSFTITPALPTGVSLNASTGVISGIPQSEMDEVHYVVTASNSYGSDTADIYISIRWPVPVLVQSSVTLGGGSSFGEASTGQVNNKLLFGNNLQGGQLWISDGTSSGTVLVKQFDGTSNIAPQSFVSLNATTTLFIAESSNEGLELWKTDGTTAGTVLVKDINNNSNNSSFPKSLVSSGSLIYFVADDGVNNNQLYKTDGTGGGTVRLSSFANSPAFLTSIGLNVLAFVVDDGLGQELYMTTGSTPSLIADLADGTGSNPRNLTFMGDYLYFKADSAEGIGSELYRTDGASIELVADIASGADSSSPENLYSFNDSLLFFSAYTNSVGRELWVTDGTTTQLVADIRPGTDSNTNSNPFRFVSYNDLAYFVATTDATGTELYKTDGDTVEAVADLFPGIYSSNPSNFHVLGDYLFFTATTYDAGTELYRIDSNDNISLIQDLTYAGNSSFSNFNIINNKLLFFKATSTANVFDLYSLNP